MNNQTLNRGRAILCPSEKNICDIVNESLTVGVCSWVGVRLVKVIPYLGESQEKLTVRKQCLVERAWDKSRSSVLGPVVYPSGQ